MSHLHSCLRVFLVIALCSIALLLPACMDAAHFASLHQSALETRRELEAQAERLELAAADASVPEPNRTASAQAAATLRDRLEDLDATIAAFEHIAHTEQDPSGIIHSVTNVAIPFLPPPMQAPALLVAATAAALLRAAQLKRAAGSIAQGIAKASQKDDEFRSLFARHADTFRSVQTPAAKRIVDETIRNQFMLRLPI